MSGASLPTPPESSGPPVQSVLRALHVLECLNQHPVTGIAQLHKQTGIPKPSLVRMLQTLAQAGYVQHIARRGGYMLTSRVRLLASGYHGEPRLVEVLAPLMDALTAKLKWPVALAVPEDDAVVIRYSTTSRSPLALLHSTIGMRLSLVTRGLGLAYLAACDSAERGIRLDLIAQSDDPENQPARDRRRLEATLEVIRRQGYALRDPSVRPVSRTLAVPVFDATRAVGSVGITWFSSTLSGAEGVERYLEPLQALAREGSAALAGAPPSATAEAVLAQFEDDAGAF